MSTERESNPAWATRRDFFAAMAACLAARGLRAAVATPDAKTGSEPESAPYLALAPYIEAGHDAFTGEAAAMEIRTRLEQALLGRTLPLSPAAQGFSPAPVQYEQVAPDVRSGRYDASDRDIQGGWKRWTASLGSVRRFAFYILPDNVVQFEIASAAEDQLHHRTGAWKQVWDKDALVRFEPMEEFVVSAQQPYFRDVTAAAFQHCPSFQDQLRRGVPYWRCRLDPATGIDIYGSNGVAVGDIDGDGIDEVYVCQPGGLPNRLYKFGPGGVMEDITEQWGVGLLDETSCGLFLDLRNSGRQDLVVLRSGGPNLFLNTGRQFALKKDAFRFATQPAGGFTGMAAADFDRDGNLDLYLCCYVYFQSEAQFTYAAPYYDARNGPPNFLFRNRLGPDGQGWFEDCTSETGMNQNNDRFSFAPAWCDFNDDGWPDLYVANDFGRKNLYVNHEGRFQDKAEEAGVVDIGPGMSASWFDYDGDGKADLYVANMWSDVGQRVVRDPQFAPAEGPKAAEAYQLHTRGNSLYRNTGDGTFHDVSGKEHVSFGRWAWSSGGHDLDNDGHPEVLVTCGMLTNQSQRDLMGFFWRQVVAKSPSEAAPSAEYQNGWNAINQFVREDLSWSGREPNVYHVRRGERYFDASGVSGFDFPEDSRAFAVCDFDGDGRPDIILKSRLGPQVRVLQNNCAHEHQSIAFRLQGTKSNRDAIGARVQVGSQTKWVEAGSGFLSQHSKRLIFGLGTATVADRVTVRWPSGGTQEWHGFLPGRTYLLKEGQAETSSDPYRAPAKLPSRAVAGDNTLGLSDTWFAEPVPLPERQQGPGLFVIRDNAKTALPPGLQASVVNLDASKDRRKTYEIFRRYLFDWRAELKTPLTFLLDSDGQALKVYGEVPSMEQVKADLREAPRHQELALPFQGTYLVSPQRDVFKFGVAFLWSGLYGQALPYLEEKSRRSPANARVFALIGQVRLAQQEFSLAEQAFRKAVELDAKTPENFYALGLVLAKQGRLEPARDALKEAIRLRPAYPDAINDLGALYMQLGMTGDAIAAFQYGTEAAPDVDILYMNLARTYIQAGQMDRARSVMQRLLDRKPDSAVARRGLQELNGR